MLDRSKPYHWPKVLPHPQSQPRQMIRRVYRPSAAAGCGKHERQAPNDGVEPHAPQR